LKPFGSGQSGVGRSIVGNFLAFSVCNLAMTTHSDIKARLTWVRPQHGQDGFGVVKLQFGQDDFWRRLGENEVGMAAAWQGRLPPGQVAAWMRRQHLYFYFSHLHLSY
jgi:hypothetical protein